ncbi:MAG: DMT family transporter, partial [Chloroflexota bacterium]
AGISGVAGLIALYYALSRGRMGVVAPVAAVTSALVPLGVAFVTIGLPGAIQGIGFIFALLAVWLISRTTDNGSTIQLQELGLPAAAGFGFGLFFVLIDQVTEGVVLWPLIAARVFSLTAIFLFAIGTRQLATLKPTVKNLPVMALSGIFDTGGNAFFLLAAQTGRLDIAAILSSLYPATTIMLAWIILKERLQGHQWIGVVAALVAVILISL